LQHVAGDVIKVTITSPEPLPAGRLLLAQLHAHVPVHAHPGAPAIDISHVETDLGPAAASQDSSHDAGHHASSGVQPDAAFYAGALTVRLDEAFTGFALATAGAEGGKRRQWQKTFVSSAALQDKDDPNRALRIELL